MSLINLVITLIVVGVLLWAVNTYIPMDPAIKRILNIVVVIAVVLWLLAAFGVFTRLGDVRVGEQAPDIKEFVIPSDYAMPCAGRKGGERSRRSTLGPRGRKEA